MRIRLPAILLIFFQLIFLDLYAQTPPDSSLTNQFTELEQIGLPGVWFGSTAWGDYDNDGDLDLFVTGFTNEYDIISILFRNYGNGNFTDQTDIYFAGVYLSCAAWGDYNNDGYLDILLTGNTSIDNSSAVSKIYRNNGNNSFTEQTSIILPGVYQGSAAWCDYNNDGKLDFILTGQTSNGPISKIYRNNGDNTFSDQTSIHLIGLKNSSVAWGDYNNDGTQDLLLTGYTGTTRFSKIYRNNGDNTFSEQTTISITGVSDGSASWGDYDSDGNLDILISGNTGNQCITKVYRNNANNTFTEQTSINLAGVQYGSASWGDFDNNGKLDIFLTGTSTSSTYFNSKIYLNDGSGDFFELDSVSIRGAYFSSAAIGDFDNDGDLDLVLCGNFGDSRMCKIYKNECSIQNTPPNIPTNLISVINGNDVTISWNRSEDFETPAEGLTYNLVIGTIPSSENILSPMSDLNTGFRKVVSLGNTNHDTSWTVKNLRSGNYYWSVQAIDNSFSGSEFSPEQNFFVDILFTEQSSISFPGTFQSSIAWGDYDNDGNLDIVLTGSPETDQGLSKIYRNNGDNTFTEQTSISLTGVYFGSAAWGDYDNDGYLDLLLSGSTGLYSRTSKIYKNNRDGTFTEQSSIPLVGVSESSVAWGDYNNDGHLDILLTGNTGTEHVSKIYRNNGDNTFSEQTIISLTGVAYGSVAWGDYDSDGYLDILLTGTTGSNRISKIYRNEGNNTFSEQSTSLTGVSYSSVAWGDYDNDGYLDILLTGYTGATKVSKIYHNNGDNSFTELTSIPLTGIYNGAVAWGDYNNDGYLDVLLTGNADDGIVSKIYRNNRDNSFTDQATISLTGVWVSSVGWCDYDKDGDLDILLSGYTGIESVTKIYRNECSNFNNAPSPPSNLVSVLDGQKNVKFTWNRATDVETPHRGLKYNLVIGTSPGSMNTLSPMSDRNTGFRRVIGLGNANHDTSIIIKGLQQGTYYWSVQSIDNGFASSVFAPEQNFLKGVKIIPEGLLNVNTNMLNMSDTVKAYLRNIFTPFELIDSAISILDSITFTATFEFINAPSGVYYLVINHRNSIETWSKNGGIQFVQGTPLTYDFTTDSTQAYESNLVKKGDKWCIYSGDVNQDGYVEFDDILEITIANQNIVTGYVVTDLNGDGFVDISDIIICAQNVDKFVGKITPE